ncbi:MAG: hypothetical protein MRY79_08690 [Alphaproteobacteria bacterium]|nr:hypothetical protein [Alphaproteobacteria bacterium]
MKSSTFTTATAAAMFALTTLFTATDANAEPDAITKQERVISCLRDEAVKIAKEKAKYSVEAAQAIRDAGSAEQLIDDGIKKTGSVFAAIVVAANDPKAVEKCAALGPQPPRR